MKWLAAVAVIAATAAALPALAADDAAIVAQDFAFEPPTVTIDPGDTVTFGNAGGSHNFVFGDQAIPAAPTDSGDAVWDTPLTRTFGTPGTYSFHCGLHGFMTGSVIVRDPTATPTPDPGGTQPAAWRSARCACAARRSAAAGAADAGARASPCGSISPSRPTSAARSSAAVATPAGSTCARFPPARGPCDSGAR